MGEKTRRSPRIMGTQGGTARAKRESAGAPGYGRS